MVKEIKRIYVLSDLKNYGPFHSLLGDIKHKNLKTDCRHIDITADRINIITLCKIRRRALKSYFTAKGGGVKEHQWGVAGLANRAPNNQSWGFS